MSQLIKTLCDNGLNEEANSVAEILQALKHLRHNAYKSGADLGLAIDVADHAIANAEK